MCSQLNLNSPANGEPCIYHWPMGNEKVDGALEIIEAIKWVCEDFPEMRLAIDNCILANCDIKSYESMRTVCERFNRVIDSLRQMVCIFSFIFFYICFCFNHQAIPTFI